jgi:hypothetical protein
VAVFSSFRTGYESPFLQRVPALRGHGVCSYPARFGWNNIDRRSHGISGSSTFVVSVHDYGLLLGTVVST